MDLGQGIVTTITTKAAARLVCRELGQRARQLDLVVLENESGALRVEVTSDELDDFERAGNPRIDSDVISEHLMGLLVGHLQNEKLLE